MKKEYTTPIIMIEEFAADEHISACYSLFCEISGDGTSFTGNAYNNNVTNWYGLSTKYDGLLHGEPCANGSSLNTETNTYYEYHKKSAIGDIELGAYDSEKGRYVAVWTSKDINGSGTYYHHGYAVLADANRPNHS